MEKIKLFVLAVNVWDADDYLNDRNTNPKNFETYLFAKRKQAEQKAKSLYVSNDIYNEGTLYEGELTEEEILKLTGFYEIDDFNEALAEPYSTNLRKKNFGEDEKGKVARAIMEDPTDEHPVKCANYDFDKSLEGAILVFWSWERHVGYARKCIEIRRAYSDDTEAILTKQDRVFATQCDVLMTADEVAEADDLQEAIREKLNGGSWKWNNLSFVNSEIEKL